MAELHTHLEANFVGTSLLSRLMHSTWPALCPATTTRAAGSGTLQRVAWWRLHVVLQQASQCLQEQRGRIERDQCACSLAELGVCRVCEEAEYLLEHRLLW